VLNGDRDWSPLSNNNPLNDYVDVCVWCCANIGYCLILSSFVVSMRRLEHWIHRIHCVVCERSCRRNCCRNR